MKILLVKLSSLGDVVHTLPVVQDIRAAMPDAQIDWVLEKSFAPLLSFFVANRQINRVITCELRRWRKSPFSRATRSEWRSFKAELQAQSYDAVIDLQGLSKSALVSRLARLTPKGKRYALANRTEGSGYEAPTRWVADEAFHIKPHVHAVKRSRELAALALGYRIELSPDFGLKTAVDQQIRTQAAIENIATPVAEKTLAKTLAFIHGTSRADKQWPLDQWVALGQRLIGTGYKIALAHGNAAEHATSQAIAQAISRGPGGQGSVSVWPMLPLDALTAALAECAGVIGVDSGVSHIAVALGLPHVQIYNFDTAWRTGPDEKNSIRQVTHQATQQVSVFARPAPSVQAVWQAWTGVIGV